MLDIKIIRENPEDVKTRLKAKEDDCGAAIDRTPGHLVLVRGWQHGKVLTADPAASTRETVLRAYDAREFANAWLNHKKGVAYIVRKK